MAQLPNEIILTVDNKVIELEALKTEREGMVADNEQRKLDGFTSLNYNETCFSIIAEKMRGLKV